jgi:hypothetical protein
MRHLKLFNEHNTIPSNFIRFDSIGCVLDPDNGFIYAMLKKDGYDHDNGYDVDEFGIQGLDANDLKTLNKYWLYSESFVREKINWELMETTKDLSLDYLDDGCRLIIYVFIGDILVYTDLYSHYKSLTKWSRYFKKNIDTISNNNDVSYKIRLDSKKNNYLSDESKELSLSVKDYFPNEELMVVYST